MMGVSGFRRRWLVAASCLLVALLSLAGCSDNDPEISLRRAGAVIDRDDDRTHVTKVTLPETATDSVIEQVTQLGRVEELDLSGTAITNAGLARLAELDELRVLDLSNTAVSDEGLEYLAKLTSLVELTLSDTRVSDEGLKKHIPEFPVLARLVLTPSAPPEKPLSRELLSGLKLGIDLAGGTNLVVQVDEKKARLADPEFTLTTDTMTQMAASIMKRANPGGVKEMTVRPIGSNRIEVIIPRADPQVVEQTKRLMTRLGSLELAILANGEDDNSLISDARNLEPDVDKLLDESGKIVKAQWHPIAKDGEVDGSYRVAFRDVKRDGTDVQQVLVKYGVKKRRVMGEHLSRVNQSTDENGQLAVAFRLTGLGANLFSDLTGANEPTRDKQHYRRLAIVLDGNVFSAPRLQSRISSNGIISGNFTKQDVDELIAVLNAGALEVPLYDDPISEMTISPTLGADVQAKGKFAIAAAAIAVVVFMAVYYWFSGLVAIACLLMNLVLVLGTMIFINATFTLPGLAGLVLTIGMAVDANVLIFERIREELLRGGSVRMAIQNGFSRAFTTIVDANVTTLIVAVVLYTIGTDQVRGFAVTLFIGIVMSMFTALYVGRLLFDIWERHKPRENIRMLSILKPGTKFNFIGWRKVTAVFSLILIIGGQVAFWNRGEDNLDIDFRGGLVVSFGFKEPHAVGEVKEKLEAKRSETPFDASFTLEKLAQEQEDQLSETGRQFRLRTTTTDEEEEKVGGLNRPLRDWISKSFVDEAAFKLQTVSISFGEIKELPASSGQEGTGHQVTLTFDSEVRVPQDNVESYVAAGLDPENQRPDVVGTEFRVEADAADSGKVFLVSFVSRLDKERVRAALNEMTGQQNGKPRFDELNSFDSAVAVEMQQSALLAMLFSLIAIVGYIWFRFQRIDFGLAAVVALVHDVLIVLGGVALAGLAAGNSVSDLLMLRDFKVNLPMIAAFLTIVGYSLNDTIVVFDRIREVRGKNPSLTIEMVNLSLNQTFSRTLLTSITTLIVVIILYVFGGEGIHGFAFCLVLGVLVGTYSSIYVASPALLWMMNSDSWFNRLVRVVSGSPGASRRAPATR